MDAQPRGDASRRPVRDGAGSGDGTDPLLPENRSRDRAHRAAQRELPSPSESGGRGGNQGACDLCIQKPDNPVGRGPVKGKPGKTVPVRHRAVPLETGAMRSLRRRREKIIKKGNDLKLENTSLNLSNIFENYEYLADNALDLSCFIEDYKKSQNSNYEEKDNKIIMNVQTKNENKYRQSKKLYIDKSTGNPLKMEITDINQNITVYILYNEVKINSLDKQNILAFRLYNTKQEI